MTPTMKPRTEKMEPLTLEKVKKEFINYEPHDCALLAQKEKLVKNSFGIEREISKEIYEEIEVSQVNLPRINPEFLSSSRKDGWPVFAVYSINNPVCYLEVKADRNGYETKTDDHYVYYEKLLYGPSILKEYYKKFFNRLKTKILENRHLYNVASIQTQFKGLIPEETRKKIRQHFSTFDDGGRIYIIEEAKGWQFKGEFVPPPPKKVDPLVIGVKNKTVYLIDSFDLTPIEEMVKREFTVD